MRIVIALGGNALLHRGEHPDAFVQETNIDRVTTAIASSPTITRSSSPMATAPRSTCSPWRARPTPL